MNLQNWQKTEVVTLEVTDGEQVQEYRLIFGTCNNYDLSLYRTRRQRLFEKLKVRFGDDWTDHDEALAMLNVMGLHLIFLAGIKRVEVKDGEQWTETKLPDAWYDVDRFPLESPAGLLEDLVDAVFAAGNEQRLFYLLPTGDDEKKVLRLTVQPSKNSLEP